MKDSVKMNEKKIKNLINTGESDFLDFKIKHHDCTSNLVHDVLSMANSQTSQKARYILFGVNDQGVIVGLDGNRRKQADIINTLRKIFNKMPRIKLYSNEIDNKVIDILEIVPNSLDAPYWLKKNYEGNLTKKKVGCSIYVRVGDTNTPIDETASDEVVEAIFRKKFGMNDSAIERVKSSLRKSKNWKFKEDVTSMVYFFDQYDPAFVFKQINGEPSTYEAPWALLNPVKKASSCRFGLFYNDRLLEEVKVIFFEDARSLIVNPKPWGVPEVIEQMEVWYLAYYYEKDSLESLLNNMMQKNYPSKSEHYKEFPEFKSEKSANQAFLNDIKKKIKKYRYYYFDRDSKSYRLLKD